MPKKRKGVSKSPRFFCESCGEEVPRDEKRCTRCGKYFSSIRCPACSFIGDEDAFKGGCPICGYSSTGSSGASSPRASNSGDKRPVGALPFWVYILTAAAFTAIMAALLFRVI